MSSLRRESVEETVVAVVEDLIQDWDLDLKAGLGPATRVVADLEFASVDIIQLCVALEQTFGRKLRFQGLLMKDGSYVGDLSIVQFARFIETRLAVPSTTV